MSPQVKKFLSALLVAMLGAVLVVLGNYVPHLPVGLQVLAISALGAVAHYVPALGTQQIVAQQIVAGPLSVAQVAAGPTVKVPPLATLCLGLLAMIGACASQPAAREAQLGAIVSGCEVSLELERDAGEAGAVNASARGCEAALRTLDPVNVFHDVASKRDPSDSLLHLAHELKLGASQV